MRTWVYLFVIVSIAFLLRIYKVTEIPPALSWDEVSIGYNAYTILKTGKDEHGKTFPLDTFAAYGDYKPPLSIYLTVPFISLFGLNDFSVRLPSVLAGVLAVLFTYWLVQELFYSEKFKQRLGLIASFVLAISPWSVNISRAAFEANIATMLIVLGTWLILYSIRTNRWKYAIWIPFVLSIYTFNSARYFAPLLSIFMLVWFRKHFIQHARVTLLGFVVAILIAAPIIPHLVSKEARLRFTEVNIFSELSVVENSNKRIASDGNTILAKILHNRRIGYTISFFKHYLDHFQLSFLFIHGDGNPKFSIQDVGQLYIVELPLFFFGILFLIRKNKSQGYFLLFWLLAGVVPAATARETPHALRILITLPTWQIFIAYGILSLLQLKGVYKKIVSVPVVISGILIVLYTVNISYYLNNYYFHYPLDYSGEWQYGYKQAIEYSSTLKESYDTIVISEIIGRPYAYTLFYTQFDPEIFWESKNATFDAAGFYNVYGFEKYRFVRNAPPEFSSRTLYILPPEQMPHEAHLLKTIHLLNGNPVLNIFEI